MGEVDIGLRPAPLSTIIQVSLVDLFSYFMVMIKGDISLRPVNFPHINMVDYTLPTQGPLRSYYKGCDRIKSIQNYAYLFYPSMPPHPHPRIPRHPNHSIPPHLFPSIPPHQCFCIHISLILLSMLYLM